MSLISHVQEMATNLPAPVARLAAPIPQRPSPQNTGQLAYRAPSAARPSHSIDQILQGNEGRKRKLTSSDSEEDDDKEISEKVSKTEERTSSTSTISSTSPSTSTVKTPASTPSAISRPQSPDIVLLPTPSLQQTAPGAVGGAICSFPPTKVCLTGLPKLPVVTSSALLPAATTIIPGGGAAVAQALAAIGGFSFAGLPAGMLPLRASRPVSSAPIVSYPAFALALQSGWACRSMKTHTK